MTDFLTESPDATFGSGGSEPYAKALRLDDQVLYLQDADSGSLTTSRAMDVSRWNDEADAADFSLLDGIRGDVLDVGCGPGRMLRAAMDLGLTALGIDVSDTAVEIARASGLTVEFGSVFDEIPREGTWGATLLVDGNIGIGGDPSALLARCAEIIAPHGAIVVEVHADPQRDHMYAGTVVDIRGHQSDAFPWAEIGETALIERASELELALDQAWEIDGRFFCRLVKA